jgi:8-oxo-dGTP pyrophosphatase MutT (NUDIX family)
VGDETPAPHSGPLVPEADVPRWLRPLVAATRDLRAADFTRLVPPEESDGLRHAGVLILFGEGPDGPDVLLLRRADSLGSHAGQVAFPGGGTECGDDDLVHTALREAGEEVGVTAAGVRPLALLPGLYVPVSGFVVTGVIAHWEDPCEVAPVDPAETAAVARLPIAYLTDPANRVTVSYRQAYSSPAFLAPGMVVWGFTAGVLTGLLRLGGWERPWDRDHVLSLDDAWRDVQELRPLPGTGDEEEANA